MLLRNDELASSQTSSPTANLARATAQKPTVAPPMRRGWGRRPDDFFRHRGAKTRRADASTLAMRTSEPDAAADDEAVRNVEAGQHVLVIDAAAEDVAGLDVLCEADM